MNVIDRKVNSLEMAERAPASVLVVKLVDSATRLVGNPAMGNEKLDEDVVYLVGSDGDHASASLVDYHANQATKRKVPAEQWRLAQLVLVVGA